MVREGGRLCLFVVEETRESGKRGVPVDWREGGIEAKNEEGVRLLIGPRGASDRAGKLSKQQRILYHKVHYYTL